MSDEEWQDVIGEAAKYGYDVRSVLCYKQECVVDNEEFNVDFLDEIIYPLMYMDGCIELLPLPDMYVACPDDMRKMIAERYQRFGLPIPEYWRERLWS